MKEYIEHEVWQWLAADKSRSNHYWRPYWWDQTKRKKVYAAAWKGMQRQAAKNAKQRARRTNAATASASDTAGRPVPSSARG